MKDERTTMDDDQGYVCIDGLGNEYPEHDYDAKDAEGTVLIECYRCGVECDGEAL